MKWVVGLFLLLSFGAWAQPSGGGGGPGPVNPCPGNDCSNANVTATGGGTQTLAGWFANTFTPQSFGAVCDGTLRPLSGIYGSLGAAQAAFPNAGITSLTQQLDWAAFQQAIYKAGASNQGRTVSVYGTCRIGVTPITFCYSNFVIQGNINSTIEYDGTTGNAVQSCGTTRIGNVVIKNIAIIPSATQTSGYLLSLLNVYSGILENLTLYGNSLAWQGLFLGGNSSFTGGSNQTHLRNVNVSNTIDECFVMTGVSGNPVSDVYIDESTFSGCNLGAANRTAALSLGAIRLDDFVHAIFVNPGTEIYDGNGYDMYLNGTSAGGTANNYNLYINGLNAEGCASWCGGVGGNYFNNIQISAATNILATDMDAINFKSQIEDVVIGGATVLGSGPGPTSAATNGITFDGLELQLGDVQLIGQGGPAGTGTGVDLTTNANYVYMSNGVRIRQYSVGIDAATTNNKNYSGFGMSFRSNTADWGSSILAATSLQGGFDGFISSACNQYIASAASITVPGCGTSIVNINGTAVPIANFTGGIQGQNITIMFEASGQTLVMTGNIITLAHGTYSPAHQYVISSYKFDGSNWWQTSAGN